ncbi:sulfatase-like hydrolase/transferase [Flavobacterium sp.]|uniref:sulfatase-like hydrolase/transferase n=1 Tax=Flavobacterium sp. TaxID=239 RepID=UPI0038FD07ED
MLRKITTVFLFSLISFSNYAQKNVILIIADDLGKDYCDMYSDHSPKVVKLPNVKRLLARGVLFNNMWSNPLCSPTRAGILTGRYSFRTGVGDVVDGNNPKLNLTENTIPKVLNLYSPGGISKACIGKWHLTSFASTAYNYPITLGFDHFEGSLTGGLGQTIDAFFNWTKITNGTKTTCTNYATTENVNNAISYLSSQPSTKPFYLQLAFNAPHTPYHLPPTSLFANLNNLSGTQTDINANPVPYFQAMTEAMDTEIGRFFDYLISSGKWNNTTIIFIGDNGDDTNVAQTNPSKGSIYQGGVSVPFIISGPDVVNPNRISTALVNSVDIFATVLELFGDTNWQSQISSTIVDSKSLMPILLNTATSSRSTAFTEIFKVTPVAGDGKTMRNTDYKLLKFDNGTEKFFNLTTDPNESNNLLTRSLNTEQTANYTALCNEMTTLVGAATYCNALYLNTESFEENKNLVFPNPFHSTIQLKSTSGNEQYELYSSFGQLIYSGSMIEKQDVSALPNGVYFLRIKDTTTVTVKLVKE